MADTGHLAHRVPPGQGRSAEAVRHHEAGVAETRLQVAARVLAELLAAGDEGGARRHVQKLRLDPDSGVDPWDLAVAATARAVRAGAGSGSRGG